METIKILLGIVIIAIGIFSPCIVYAIWVMDKIKNIEEEDRKGKIRIMNKENNIVYVQTKNGIFKCYKLEQMHKPIYYPVESKTKGYIDYYDAIRILNIDDLYEQVKKQKEVIDKVIEYLEEPNRDSFDYSKAKLLDILKEVSE